MDTNPYKAATYAKKTPDSQDFITDDEESSGVL
jgi:hypothetical protein